MSSLINFKLKELNQLADDKNSCVVKKTVAQNLALQPWCLGNIKESIKNLLDYKIWKYVKEFDGILLSYKNLRILQNVGKISNDNAIYFPVQADYFIFKPYVGSTLKGIVNKKSDTHLGILVHRVFNVVVPRPTDEPGNTWIGTSIQENQEVVFKVVVLDLYGALPYIRGELDERRLKLGHEDDETFELSHSKSIYVSYVDFDKIKPNPKQLTCKPLKSTKNNTGIKKLVPKSKKPIIDNNAVNNGESAVETEAIVQSKVKLKGHKLSNPKQLTCEPLKSTKNNTGIKKLAPKSKKPIIDKNAVNNGESAVKTEAIVQSKVKLKGHKLSNPKQLTCKPLKSTKNNTGIKKLAPKSKKPIIDNNAINNGESAVETEAIVQSKVKLKGHKLSDTDISDIESNAGAHKKRKKKS